MVVLIIATMTSSCCAILVSKLNELNISFY